MKAARYLNWRINRQVNAEDTVLASVQDGMEFPELRRRPAQRRGSVPARLRCQRLWSLIPEARLHHAPQPGWSRGRA